ncbi:MAG: KH domain-containing protein [Oscillospiraceae bacterium]|nr:KH domain-containing protein [Clostridiales bacterium]MDD4094868.1 KH domain-containing protein [Oscillospiraceae bacterium]
MSELLTTIAKTLVSNPDEVAVKESERGNTVILELSVSPEDMGKIIGKGGRRAQAIRTIMKAKYLRDGKRVIVDIVG